MEPLPRYNKSRILTRICYMSYIIPYYGYLHETAEYFRQLSKAARAEWDKNLTAIVQVIMKHQECKMIIEFSKGFDRKAAWYLKSNHRYLYFKIKALVKEHVQYRDIGDFIRFVYEENYLLNIDDVQTFKEIHIETVNNKLFPAENFINQFLGLGFPQEALLVDLFDFPYGIRRKREDVPDYTFPYINFVKYPYYHNHVDYGCSFQAIQNLKIFEEKLDRLPYMALPGIKIKHLSVELNALFYILNKLGEHNLELESVQKLTILKSGPNFGQEAPSVVSKIFKCLKSLPNVAHLHIEMHNVDVNFLDKILYFEEKYNQETQNKAYLNSSRFQTIELGTVEDYSRIDKSLQIEKEARMSYAIKDPNTGKTIWRPPFGVDNITIRYIFPNQHQSKGIFYQDSQRNFVYIKLEGIQEIPITLSMIESQSKIAQDKVGVILYDENFNLPEVEENYFLKLKV